MTPRPLNLVGRKHPALHRLAASVDDFEQARWLTGRMRATLAGRRGAALAAPQVGYSVSLIVTADGRGFANPVLLSTAGGVEVAAEGCLSLPGRWFRVPRHRQVMVRSHDVDGGVVVTEAEGFDARVFQHEIDHLDGLLLDGRFEEWRESG